MNVTNRNSINLELCTLEIKKRKTKNVHLLRFISLFLGKLRLTCSYFKIEFWKIRISTSSLREMSISILHGSNSVAYSQVNLSTKMPQNNLTHQLGNGGCRQNIGGDAPTIQNRRRRP